MSENSNIYVSFNWFVSVWVLFSYLFTSLIAFDWMLDIRNFIFLGTGYFCIPINLCSRTIICKQFDAFRSYFKQTQARQNHAQPRTNYSPQLSWNLSMYSTQCSENDEVFQSVLWEQPLLPALFEMLYYFRWSFPWPQVTNVLSYMHWLVLTWKLKEGPSKFLELSFCSALLSSTVLQTLDTSVLSDSALSSKIPPGSPCFPLPVM